jgi:glycosyltransferase involved in cell wall biosynthesis
MRIFLYHNLLSGGGKRTLQEQVRRLSEKHQIDVVSLSTAHHEFADLRSFVHKHEVIPFTPSPLFRSPFGRLNPLLRFLDLLRIRAISRSISRRIREDSYDILFAHPCQFETSPSVLQTTQGIRTIYYCQEPLRLLYEKMPSRPYDQAELGYRQVLNRVDPFLWVFRWYLRRNDRENTRSAGKVLVNSEFMRNSVNRIYNIDARVSYHGIDVDLFRPLGLTKCNILLAVGSLTPLKGYDFLIHSIALLPEGGRPVLVVASNFQNQPERAYLEALAEQFSVKVEFRGNISDRQLVELYNQARITLYAAIREPFGLVPLESMACGTPVVTVKDGGMQETIRDGEDGFVLERQPELFAAAIQRLLSNPILSQEFGRKGRQHVLNEWTWEKAITSLEKHLLEV